jgi:hypothetical protein
MKIDPSAKWTEYPVEGTIGRHQFPIPADDFT